MSIQSSTNGNVETLTPFHRGVIGAFIGSFFGLYVARGSRSFLSVPFSSRKWPFICLIFVYNTQPETTVFLETNEQNRFILKRFYINTRYPFVSRKARENSYKSLFIGFRRIRMNQTMNLVVKIVESAEPYKLCEFVPAKPIFKDDFADIAAAVADGSREETSPEKIAELEMSILAQKGAISKQAMNAMRIKLYGKFLLNHRRNRTLLKGWLENYDPNESSDNKTEFEKELDELTSPFALGPHGYNPSFKKLNLDQVESELLSVIAEFQEQHVYPFLNSGTLLGYYRDGRPIPHDDDFDLGVYVRGDTFKEITNNWKLFLAWLKTRYPTIYKGSFAAIRLSNGVQVDLFPAWAVDGHAFVFPYCYQDVSESAFFPFKSLEIRGRFFPIPASPDEVLSINYGSDWRTPDPFWKFDYKASKKRFGNTMNNFKI